SRDWTVSGVQTCALPISLLVQRHDPVARLERARRGPREQRRVEQVVDLAHERHARAAGGQGALEAAGGVEAAESAAGYSDVPGQIGRASCRERVEDRGEG